ncbi:GntR family transcriptional regulator [uncultured Corynebacterium sp.]|uniref:GntR family transcriptional regulator n=1 Tax=uncultured Corynebacterium sp. TaxID=159447 RepID=UPI00288928F6|nr:GntR family transcriptional regulator [uncultured Corynebacterium sp.]
MTKLADAVVKHVRGAVASGAMAPNKWYSVAQLADDLGMSRSPVREGLLRLEEAGLVRFVKNRGFIVIENGPRDVAEIFSVRLGIEPAAAYRAALLRKPEDLAAAYKIMGEMRMHAERGSVDEFFAQDRALHSLIFDMSSSKFGKTVVQRLRDVTAILGHSTAGASRSTFDILGEHGPIIAAIEEKDPDAARDHMARHLVITGKLLIKQAVKMEGREDGVAERETDLLWRQYLGGSAE